MFQGYVNLNSTVEYVSNDTKYPDSQESPQAEMDEGGSGAEEKCGRSVGRTDGGMGGVGLGDKC